MNDLDRRLPLALEMADLAGRLLRPRFRRPVAIETKADLSPVSEADREVETALRSLVEVECPGDGFIGEEFDALRPGATYVWVVDPIDGTRAFLAGMGTFVTLIALLRDGVPVLGIIDQPTGGDRWVGVEGRQTTHGAALARTRPCSSLSASMLGCTDPSLMAPAAAAAFQRVAGATQSRVVGGDGLLYGLLASGHLDVVCEASLGLHDFAALHPVVAGAGGWIGDWSGQPLTKDSDGRVLAVGDRRLLPAALGLLAEGASWPLER